MKLSIIVPVYNVEGCLERCVQSIVTQGLDDFEVLLVDDGSTDRSGMLCDELCSKNECIRVIHQPNGGLSAARNRGIDEARGEYVTFVDSDDELCTNTLKENLDFLMAHPKVDMLEYPIEVYAGSAQAYRLSFPDELQESDVFADWVRREGYCHTYACNKIFRAELWQSQRFPVGEYFEDGAVMRHVVERCRAIYYSGHGCYRYIYHSGSITTSHSYAKHRRLFLNNHQLYLKIKDDTALRTESLRLWICCLNQLIDMGRCSDVANADYHHIVDEVSRALPSYGELLQVGWMDRNFKLLPLPVLGLKGYLRCYVALTSKL